MPLIIMCTEYLIRLAPLVLFTVTGTNGYYNNLFFLLDDLSNPYVSLIIDIQTSSISLDRFSLFDYIKTST